LDYDGHLGPVTLWRLNVEILKFWAPMIPPKQIVYYEKNISSPNTLNTVGYVQRFPEN